MVRSRVPRTDIERRGVPRATQSVWRTRSPPSWGALVRVLLTGAGGQLGLELAEILPHRGHEVVALDRRGLDVADAGAVEGAVAEHGPEMVVNAAAYTN